MEGRGVGGGRRPKNIIQQHRKTRTHTNHRLHMCTKYCKSVFTGEAGLRSDRCRPTDRPTARPPVEELGSAPFGLRRFSAHPRFSKILENGSPELATG